MVRRTRTRDDEDAGDEDAANEDAGDEDAANEDAGPSTTRALYDRTKRGCRQERGHRA